MYLNFGILIFKSEFTFLLWWVKTYAYVKTHNGYNFSLEIWRYREKWKQVGGSMYFKERSVIEQTKIWVSCKKCCLNQQNDWPCLVDKTVAIWLNCNDQVSTEIKNIYSIIYRNWKIECHVIYSRMSENKGIQWKVVIPQLHSSLEAQ